MGENGSKTKKQESFKERLLSSFGGKKPPQKRNRKNLFAMIFANAGSKFLQEMPGEYLQYFYTEFMRVSAAGVSLIMSIGMIVDGVTDILMGAIVDRVHTKRGKAAHWFIWMGIPCAIASVAIWFCPQGWSNLAKLIYLGIVYNVYNTCLTTIRLPSFSLISLCYNEPEARQQAGFLNSFFATLVSTLLSSGLAPAVALLGSGIMAYRGVAVVTCGIGAILIMTTGYICIEIVGSKAAIRHVRETEGEEKAAAMERIYEAELKKAIEEKKKHKINNATFLRDVGLLFRNQYWIIKQLMVLFNSVHMGFMYGCATYFATYVLGNLVAVSGIFLAISIGSTIGMIVVAPFMVKLESRQIGMLGGAMSILGMLIASGGIFMFKSLPLLYVGLFIDWFGNGFTNSISDDLMARAIDFGEWKFGIRLDGISYSGNSVMFKIMLSLSTAVLGVILTMSGYKGGMDTLPQHTIVALESLFLLVPLACNIGTFITFLFYRLTNARVKEMKQELAERAAKRLG